MKRMYKAANWQNGSAQQQLLVSMRCPNCRHLGVWESFGGDIVLLGNGVAFWAGHRRCPNTSCQTHVFVVHDSKAVLISYPAETIDFDATDVPSSITSALEEAITCHANQCFVTSAIMVRKTLEELCTDRGAKGPNLKARIKDLATKVVLPSELMDGLDDIRLLGNDAAHIESQEYNKIGQEELDVAIEFTKEVLKAIFQYAKLLGKLKALRKPTTP